MHCVAVGFAGRVTVNSPVGVEVCSLVSLQLIAHHFLFYNNVLAV